MYKTVINLGKNIIKVNRTNNNKISIDKNEFMKLIHKFDEMKYDKKTNKNKQYKYRNIEQIFDNNLKQTFMTIRSRVSENNLLIQEMEEINNFNFPIINKYHDEYENNVITYIISNDVEINFNTQKRDNYIYIIDIIIKNKYSLEIINKILDQFL